MTDKEVEWVEIGGFRFLASDAVCPVCKTLDVNLTAFEQANHVWRFICSKNHEWEVHPL